jgi:hypothetical protein
MMKKSDILVVSLLTLLGCSLFSKPSDPVEVLPAATQEGRNTLGCLLNGKVWVPKGNHGTSNLNLSYDPTYNHGTFDLRAYRYPDASSYLQSLVLFSDSLSGTGSFSFSKGSNQAAVFVDHTTCEYVSIDADVESWGDLMITRFDLSKGIISGTFELTLTRNGCDTVRMTQGRFDMKI